MFMFKEALVTAYTVYEDVLTIIYTLADNNYVSASEIAQLINIILNENVVEAKHINYILKDNKVIKNKSKTTLSENKGANKYYINKNVKQSLVERNLVKELQDNNYKLPQEWVDYINAAESFDEIQARAMEAKAAIDQEVIDRVLQIAKDDVLKISI